MLLRVAILRHRLGNQARCLRPRLPAVNGCHQCRRRCLRRRRSSRLRQRQNHGRAPHCHRPYQHHQRRPHHLNHHPNHLNHHQAHQVRQVHQAHQVHQAQRAHQAHQAHQVHQAQQALQAHQVQQVQQVQRAHQAHQAHQVQRAPRMSQSQQHRGIIKENKENDSSPYPDLPGRYSLLERIGDGAFSTVFRAHDKELDIDVAIKIIDKTELTKSQMDVVLKEVAIMRRLDHPNVVKMYNYINTETVCFIIMEYVSGGELFNQIVKLTYFSEDLSRHVIIQVVKAIDYLHSEVGVVHRDIKPENLFFEKIPLFPREAGSSVHRRASDDSSKVDEGGFVQNVGGGTVGRVKLGDFGLSKVLWDSNTKTPCGTASYTAPEIVKDESYSKSVDMWAIGCVLYTMLCGFPPFYDSDPKTLTLKVSRGEYTFLSPWWDEISKEAKDLVSHLLTVDPTKRYSPEEVLNDPWILKNSRPTTPALDAPVYQTKS
ncbi:Pkinase-domain-containing protein, partial [Cyberlindnera jadinii NRRL Y-1542]